MKTLYESILDDEDILVGDLKRDANNPFLILYNYYISNGEKIPFGKQKDVSSILKSLELPLKSKLTAFEVFILSPKVLSIRDDSNETLFCIAFDGVLVNWDNDDYKVYIEFDPMGNWGKKGINYYKKLWKNKYNLSETGNPNAYTIKII